MHKPLPLSARHEPEEDSSDIIWRSKAALERFRIASGWFNDLDVCSRAWNEQLSGWIERR